NPVAGAVVVHDPGDILLIVDLLPVNVDDEVATNPDGNISQVGLLVAAGDSGALGRAPRSNLHHQQAVICRQAKLVRELGADGQGAHPQRGPAHAAQRNQVTQNCFSGIDGDCETDAGALSNRAQDESVDSDYFAARVQQRSTGVAGIDGGI